MNNDKGGRVEKLTVKMFCDQSQHFDQIQAPARIIVHSYND